MTSILDKISDLPSCTIPFFWSASAYAGFNLAITVAEEGKRVLVVARPHLHPPHLADHMNLIDIIDDDLTAESLGFVYAKLSAVFDLIVFVREYEAFSGGDAEETAEEFERLLTEMHLMYLTGASGRYSVMRPEGNDGFNEERCTIGFLEPTARQHSLH